MPKFRVIKNSSKKVQLSGIFQNKTLFIAYFKLFIHVYW